MATAEKIQELIDYYVNLLIIQYHNKPKAQETIALFVKELVANGILFDIENGYSLGIFGGLTYDSGAHYDSGLIYDESPDVSVAVGKQLDIIGKYVGVDRFYKELNLINFFACTFYEEIDPDSKPKFGFSTYLTFDGDNHNGTLTYDKIISSNNRLTDEFFLKIIKLKIYQNYSNHSHQSIDNAAAIFFPGTLRPETFGDMKMFYFITDRSDPVLKAAVYKKILPRPMAVGMVFVDTPDPFTFAVTDYSGYQTPYGLGFSDYSNYDSLSGKVLTYDQITQG